MKGYYITKDNDKVEFELTKYLQLHKKILLKYIY